MSEIAKYAVSQSVDVYGPAAHQQWLQFRPRSGDPFLITKKDIHNAIEFIYNVLLWPEWCDRYDIKLVYEYIREAQDRMKRCGSRDSTSYLESYTLPEHVSAQEGYKQIAAWLDRHYSLKRGHETEWFPMKYGYNKWRKERTFLSYFRVLARWVYKPQCESYGTNLKTLIYLFEHRRAEDICLDPVYPTTMQQTLSNIVTISTVDINPKLLIEDLRSYLVAQTPSSTQASQMGLTSVAMLVLVLYYMHPHKRSDLQTALQSLLSAEERAKVVSIIDMEFRRMGSGLLEFSKPQFEAFQEAIEALFPGEKE